MQLLRERPGTAPSTDLTARRHDLDAAVASGAFRTDPAADPISLGGKPALAFRPPGEPRATVLHFHGGGFRLGRPEQAAPFAAALARQAGVTVICPRYRLAPEHPFPAALNDARAALTALQADGERRIVLSGDSAGGGIAAALAAVSVTDADRPCGLILLSPWLDLTLNDPAFDANAATDPLFSREAAQDAAELYLQGIGADHPLASPLLGPVAAYPPTFVSVGDGEVLFGDACRLHAALLEAGVAARLLIVPGMEHVSVTRGFQLTGAAETFSAFLAFLDTLLDLAAD